MPQKQPPNKPNKPTNIDHPPPHRRIQTRHTDALTLTGHQGNPNQRSTQTYLYAFMKEHTPREIEIDKSFMMEIQQKGMDFRGPLVVASSMYTPRVCPVGEHLRSEWVMGLRPVMSRHLLDKEVFQVEKRVPGSRSGTDDI